MSATHLVVPAVIGLFFFLSDNVVDAQSYDSCTNPRREPGECKVISSCPPLYSILQHRPISARDADFLRRSQCGFEGTLPKVCCVETSGFTEEPFRPSVPPTPRPAKTSGGLLPNTTVCGTGVVNKIFGGEATDLDEFPWMVLVEYEKPNRQSGFYCGGVLINSRYVLTAAHCVKGKDLPKSWKLTSIRLGEYNTETDEDCVDAGFNHRECAPAAVDVPVEEKIAHEDYDPYDINQYHDIALLRLSRNVKFTDYIKPICLPVAQTVKSKTFAGENLWVAGWGKTESRSESNVKLKVEVPVRSVSECSKTYGPAGVDVKSGQICAGGVQGKDSCRGDSGGPLMAVASNNKDTNWYAIGIVSFGPSLCGMRNWPAIYTRVAEYTDWINKNLKE